MLQIHIAQRQINLGIVGIYFKPLFKIFRRLGKVARLAVFEMKEDEQIPEKVAINEAVELAKKFGGKDAPSFVNGILARLVDKE